MATKSLPQRLYEVYQKEKFRHITYGGKALPLAEWDSLPLSDQEAWSKVARCAIEQLGMAVESKIGVFHED